MLTGKAAQEVPTLVRPGGNRLCRKWSMIRLAKRSPDEAGRNSNSSPHHNFSPALASARYRPVQQLKIGPVSGLGGIGLVHPSSGGGVADVVYLLYSRIAAHPFRLLNISDLLAPSVRSWRC